MKNFVRILTVTALLLPLAAQAKTARCQIESDGEIVLNRSCRFTLGSQGSFALENHRRNKPLFGEVLMVSVDMVAPGVAEVRGLTKDGINSRWGTFRRSRTQPACWIGDGTKICAY